MAPTYKIADDVTCLGTEVVIVLAICNIDVELHEVDLAAVVSGCRGARGDGTLSRRCSIDHSRRKLARIP